MSIPDKSRTENASTIHNLWVSYVLCWRALISRAVGLVIVDYASVLYILCTERISFEDGKKLEEDCRSICVSHLWTFLFLSFHPLFYDLLHPSNTFFYLSLTQICFNQMQKLFNLHTMCPWKIRWRKKNEAKYNDTHHVEMQRMTMTLEFQGFVGMEQKQDNSYNVKTVNMPGKQ